MPSRNVKDEQHGPREVKRGGCGDARVGEAVSGDGDVMAKVNFYQP